MFDELFSGEADLFDEKTKPNATHTNCASNLQKPEESKASCNFVGLKNQGSTCYLNSSLQILFMTPQFRKAIYDLPLCNFTLSNPSDFIVKNQKYDILLALQKLFSDLNYLNIQSITTKDLTNAFKWSSGEGNDQQDSQEFIRLLLFDILDRILSETSHYGIINSLYQVTIESRMKCGKCNTIKSRQENEYVLPITVYQIPSLNESLKIIFGKEEVIEDYYCEVCQEKVIVLKTGIITNLPIYLNLGLNRFIYDTTTWERVKVTTSFEYPLEINMKPYCDCNDKSMTDSAYIYQLYGIIVHSGTPYSGHYFSYIRDLTGQGNWDLPYLNDYLKDPIDPSQSENVTEIVKEIVDSLLIKIEEDAKNTKQNKNQGKKQKQQLKKKKETNEDKYSRLNYDQCDFPIPYEDKSLNINWFEFNDSSISPIRIGRLQKVFKSRTSAYMLFYVKRDTIQSQQNVLIDPPTYLMSNTNELNEKLNSERLNYQNELNSLIITLYTSKCFLFDPVDKIYRLIENNNEPLKQKIKFTNSYSQLLNILQKKNKDDLEMFLFTYDPVSRFVTYKLRFLTEHLGMTLKDLGIYHNCNLLLVDKSNDSSFLKNTLYIGEDYEPITITLLYQSTVKKVNMFGNALIEELEFRIKDIYQLPSTVLSTDIQLSFDSNGKDIDVKKIAYDKKDNHQRTIKELRLQEKKVISISVNLSLSQSTIQENKIVFDIITCFVRMEKEDEDIHYIRIGLEKPFSMLFDEIKKEFGLVDEKNEMIPFRVRNEASGIIIPKEVINKSLCSDESFIEDNTRLKVEIGETYSHEEILIHILYLNSSEEKEEKEFIGNPSQIKIEDLKKGLMDNVLSKDQWSSYGEYKVFKVNCFNEPIKVIKVENMLISKMGIKDNDYLWLKSSKDINVDNCYISLYQTQISQDLQDYFKPVDDNAEVAQLKILKIATIETLKKEIREKLNLTIDNLSTLRLRLLSKFNEPERILKDPLAQLKKYNLESPVKILIEQLSEPETLNGNQLLLVFMLRNTKEKIYYNKRVEIFEYYNNICSADQLYSFCRNYSKWTNITIAKYSRAHYKWEAIPEIDGQGVVNLRKGQYTIRDSDWIGIRNNNDQASSSDDFTTEFDIKGAEVLQKTLLLSKGESNKKHRAAEKPLRITLEDN